MPAVNQLKLSFAMYLLRRGKSSQEAAETVELHPKYLNDLVKIVNQKRESVDTQYQPFVIASLADIVDIGVLDVLFRCRDAQFTTDFVSLCTRQNELLRLSEEEPQDLVFTSEEWAVIVGFVRLKEAVHRYDTSSKVNTLNLANRRVKLYLSGMSGLAMALKQYIRVYDDLVPRPLVRQERGKSDYVSDNGKPYWYELVPAVWGHRTRLAPAFYR